MSQSSEPASAEAAVAQRQPPDSTFAELVRIRQEIADQTEVIRHGVASTKEVIEQAALNVTNAIGSLAISEAQFNQDSTTLLQQMVDLLTQLLANLAPSASYATNAVLTIEGDPMPLTIDSENAQAVLGFVDRDGDPVNAPDGAIGTATSDNTAVLTVGDGAAGTDSAGNSTIVFALTEVSAGTANLSATATDASGNALTYTGPDGTSNTIGDPAPVAVTVNPGAAAAEVFTVPGN
jgi:hypothetical protein